MDKVTLSRYTLWLASFDKWCRSWNIDRKTGLIVLEIISKLDDEGLSLLKWTEVLVYLEHLKKDEQYARRDEGAEVNTEGDFQKGDHLRVMKAVPKAPGIRALKEGEIVEFVQYSSEDKQISLVDCETEDSELAFTSKYVPTESLEKVVE